MSETSGGWFLTHGDGEVHGPFSLPALVDAARMGNILTTTQLRHETHTSGQWLPATRIRPVAEVIANQGTSASSPGSGPKSQASKNQSAPANQQASPTQAAGGGTTASPKQSTFQPPPQKAAPVQLTSAARPAPVESAAASTAPAATASSISGVGVEVQKKKRGGTLRGALTVPETFGAAALALFDFRFRYFITPWIIKITWGIMVALALTWLLLFTIQYVIQPIVSSANADVSGDIVVSQDSGQSRSRARNDWEFQPPTSVSENMGRVITYVTTVLFTAMLLLYVRVLMEMAIVVFRIAIDLAAVKDIMQEK